MKVSQHRISLATGFTLIEMTLVIAVLLTLISVLFIGAGSYKEGANRAKCLLTISSVQKAVRSYQNFHEMEAGDVIAYSTLVGEGRLIEYITPCGSQDLSSIATEGSDGFAASGYTGLGEIPESGTPFLSCNIAGLEHVPAAIGGW